MKLLAKLHNKFGLITYLLQYIDLSKTHKK